MSGSIPGSWASVSSRLGRLICGLGGHELILSAERGRLSLKCMSCLYETPGWTIKQREIDLFPRREGHAGLVQQSAR